jgi:hypothetical protein
LSFVNGILFARDLELLQHDLFRNGSDAISEKETVGQYVCKFFSYALRVCFFASLKALEEFASFDRNALGEVFWSVKLRPVAFSDECCEGFVDGLANHWVQSREERGRRSVQAAKQQPPPDDVLFGEFDFRTRSMKRRKKHVQRGKGLLLSSVETLEAA